MEEQYSYELEKLGKQIRKFRKLKKLTQVDLELICGVGNGDISRIENGRKNLEFYTIVKLAHALEIELNELFIKEK
jgi:transcriptional regulator with XRE-family HTH domain